MENTSDVENTFEGKENYLMAVLEIELLRRIAYLSKLSLYVVGYWK